MVDDPMVLLHALELVVPWNRGEGNLPCFGSYSTGSVRPYLEVLLSVLKRESCSYKMGLCMSKPDKMTGEMGLP